MSDRVPELRLQDYISGTEAVRDKFRLDKREDELIVHYRSPNHLCDMYKAIAQHIFRHYGDNATITEDKCMKRGDVECQMRIRWS